MANDPRLYSAKPCPPAYLGKSSAMIADAQSDRQKFFNALGKAGDLQILNNKTLFGSSGTQVGQGLRTLSSISNSVRTGCGALPTVLGSAIGQGLDTGANWVLENIGFSKTVVDQARYFSPAIANQAYGQAQQIYQRVQQGNFKLTDIPSYLQDFQNLERLARNIYNPPSSVQSKFKDFCESSPYAVDLALRAPKYKFLYIVQFIFNNGYESLGGLDFPFVVKKSSRPNMQIEMDDVNYYNFRSKVITRTKFEDMTMSFHDDGLNFGTRFWNAYMTATAPVTNFTNWSETVDATNLGMDFDNVTDTSGQSVEQGQIPVNFYSASRGPLVNDNLTVIQEVRLFHFFDWGRQMNVFKFFNPRITQLQMDDVDMAGGDLNEFSVVFNYDAVHIDTNVAIGDHEYGIEQQQRGAFYILKDVESAAQSGPSNIGLVPEQKPRTADQCNPGGLQNTRIPGTGPATGQNNPLIVGGGIGGGVGQGI